MLALKYSDWHKLTLCEQPMPAFASDEVLLKVTACGICGSELEAIQTRSPRRTPPLILGHEFCGEIVDTGPAVTKFRTGDKVISHSLVHCANCSACTRGDIHLCDSRVIFGMGRQGAFADYVAAPERSLIAWPQGLPASAACLAEPLANGVHVAALTRHQRTQTALVIGAGTIGLMVLQALLAEADMEILVSDLETERLHIAKSLGASAGIEASQHNLAEAIRDASTLGIVDLVVDAVGATATKQLSLDVCRPGGTVVWIGLHENAMRLKSYDITLGELSVIGSYAATLQELQQAAKLLNSGKVQTGSWTQSYPLRQGENVFDEQLSLGRKDIKAVLCP